MLHVTSGRFAWTYLVGFFVASNLNWAVAETVLNPWLIPRLEGFMRTNAGGADIAHMTLGFALPLMVAAILTASLPRPRGWLARASWSAVLVSVAAFFGTYTFISGWGNVGFEPLMVTAVCDSVTLIAGTIVIGFLQQWRGKARAAA